LSLVVYAVADLHLGLRPSGWWAAPGHRQSRDVHSDQPAKVAEFLRWLEAVPPDGSEVRVLHQGVVVPRTLRRATHLILLGDILELWDGENANILFSAVPVGHVLSALKAEKVYVLGNHDSVLASLGDSYPVGFPGLRVVEDSYPEADADGRVHPLTIGRQGFVFVHGHQLDLSFRAARWLRLLGVLGRLRQFGAATGAYAMWVFGLLFLIALPFVLRAPSVLGGVIAGALFSLAFPQFYMRIARPLSDVLGGSKRYRRDRALRGFADWWRGFGKHVDSLEDLGIVFGHTHYLDWIELPRRTGGAGGAEPVDARLAAALDTGARKRRTLYNISAWVRVSGPHAPVVRDSFFYADDVGPLFLGWDSSRKAPFHIPFEFLAHRTTDPLLSPSEEVVAQQLGWPAELISKRRSTAEAVGN
jgi:UDP-2,3-diacylglucosamine pyrophosphatase LpxH